MVQENRANNPLDILHVGITYCLAGGIIFWFVEMITIIIGIPYSFEFKKFIENGLSRNDAMKFTLITKDVPIAFLVYLLVSLIIGVTCSAIMYMVDRKKSKLEIESKVSTIYLVFTFYIFSVVWLNIYLQFLFTVKLLIANMILLFICFIFAYILYKIFSSKISEIIFPTFLMSAFILYLFMMGFVLIVKILSMKLFSIKGVIYVFILVAICTVLLILYKYLNIKSLTTLTNRYKIFSKGIFVIIIATSLTLISACIIIISGYKTIIGGKVDRSENKPNILFIVMDTTRADHLSSYGYGLKTSPYLDRIAGEGILFKKAFSTTGWTLPAHISMFTGLYPTEHGVGYGSPYLSGKIETITDILKNSGYKTLGYSNNPWISAFTGFSRQFDDFQVGWNKFEKRYFYKMAYNKAHDILNGEDYGMKIQDHGANLTTRYVSEWIKKKANYPFFIFINYMEPHLPYNPPAPYDSLFMPKNISDEERKKYSPDPTYAKTLFEPKNRIPKELAVINALYDGEIRYLDEKIWMLYEKLAKLNILDNTVIIITSDHGDNLGDHSIIGHGYGLYNTLIEVPLIIRYPKYFPAGTVINDKVQNTDIFYTILDIIGEVRNPSVLELGKSLATRIKKNEYEEMIIAERDRSVINLEWAKSEGLRTDHFDKTQKVIISGKYKYIWASNGEEELYDIVNDPEESISIASKNSQVVNVFRDKMEMISLKSKPVTPTSIPKQKIDEATKDQLKSLGYINK